MVARGERPYTESLSATLKLDQDVYVPGEDAKITITRANRGEHAISGITAACNTAGNSNQFGDPTNPECRACCHQRHTSLVRTEC